MKRNTIVLMLFGFLTGVTVIAYGLIQTSFRDATTTPISSIRSDTAITIRMPATHKIIPTNDGPETPDGPNSHWFYSPLISVEEDTVVTGFTVAMEGADSSILHHVSVSVVGRIPTICPWHFMKDGGAHEIYSASRHTLEPTKLPAPYGIPLAAGEQLIVEFMAHPQAEPHGAHTANSTLEPTLVVTLMTDDSHTTTVDFIRLRLDDSPCAPPLPHQAFVVPTSSVETNFIKTAENNEPSASYQFTSSTTIVLGGANFWPQKGGQDVTVLLDNAPVEQFIAEPAANPSDWNIPLSLTPITVPALSTITIQSTYLNPFDVPVKDAAGMYGFYYTTP